MSFASLVLFKWGTKKRSHSPATTGGNGRCLCAWVCLPPGLLACRSRFRAKFEAQRSGKNSLKAWFLFSFPFYFFPSPSKFPLLLCLQSHVMGLKALSHAALVLSLEPVPVWTEWLPAVVSVLMRLLGGAGCHGTSSHLLNHRKSTTYQRCASPLLYFEQGLRHCLKKAETLSTWLQKSLMLK